MTVSFQRELQNIIDNCHKKRVPLRKLNTVKLIEIYHPNLIQKVEIYLNFLLILVFFIYKLLLFYANFRSTESFVRI